MTKAMARRCLANVLYIRHASSRTPDSVFLVVMVQPGSADGVEGRGLNSGSPKPGGDMDEPRVTEMRLVVTASDYEEALRFYRDVLGLPERAAYSSPGGRVTILEAGRATPELAAPPHAAYIDEVEVGRRVAGHIRVAFAVADSAAVTGELAGAGATVIAEPTRTPWASLNARLEAPADLQLTLFSDDAQVGDARGLVFAYDLTLGCPPCQAEYAVELGLVAG